MLRAGVLRREDPVEITFEDDEGVHFTTSASTPDARLTRIHTSMGQALSGMYRSLDRGLLLFKNRMDFSSEQEAEARLAAAMGKALMKSLLDVALDATGPMKPYLKAAMDVGMAAWDEGERASTASGDAQIAAFIGRVIDGIDRADRLTMEAHAEGLDGFLQAYPGSRTSTIIEAEEEAWLQRADADVRRFRQATPDAQSVRQRITERFADTGRLTAPISQGGRQSGTLYLNLRASRSRSGVLQVNGDSSWTLATTAPRPDRIAQNLADAISSVADTRLPKILTIGSGMLRPTIWFVDPARPQYRGHDEAASRAAWSHPEIREAALAITRIRGASR